MTTRPVTVPSVFSSKVEPGSVCWAILGPEGEIGWGVAWSQSNADEAVRFLDRAYEAGRERQRSQHPTKESR